MRKTPNPSRRVRGDATLGGSPVTRSEYSCWHTSRNSILLFAHLILPLVRRSSSLSFSNQGREWLGTKNVPVVVRVVGVVTSVEPDEQRRNSGRSLQPVLVGQPFSALSAQLWFPVCSTQVLDNRCLSQTLSMRCMTQRSSIEGHSHKS